jgi:hypothetical protein
MDHLLAVVEGSLTELRDGLRGRLVMTDAMDRALASLAVQRVPDTWAAVAYPSTRCGSLTKEPREKHGGERGAEKLSWKKRRQ